MLCGGAEEMGGVACSSAFLSPASPATPAPPLLIEGLSSIMARKASKDLV